MPVDPTFGHHWTPNLRRRVDHEGGGFLIRTNASGLRSEQDFELARRPGVFRALVFGDSNTGRRGCQQS